MKNKTMKIIGLCVIVFMSSVAVATAQGPTSAPRVARAPRASMGTEFTYQGQLKKNGVPVYGVACNFDFQLYDDSLAGSAIGSPVSRSTSVTNGLFTVQLDFGPAAFTGEARWLEIKVTCPGDSIATTLTPRQQLRPTPYAIYAGLTGSATNFSGSLSGDVTGTQNATQVERLRGKSISTTAPTDRQLLQFDATSNQWKPATPATTSVRRFTIGNNRDGSQAKTGCPSGFHMAQLWEIYDLGSVQYVEPSGSPPPGFDYTAGPSQQRAWIRTGGGNNHSTIPGAANCDGWTSNSNQHYGSTVALQSNWSTIQMADRYFNPIAPWDASTSTCDLQIPMWCVSD